MNEQGDELAIRRILVALDASHHSLAALEAAAELAASLKAELEGLFVEDIRLLRAATLPVVREVRFPFDSSDALDLPRMQRELRAQAAMAARALQEACQARQIKGTFRVLRGQVTPSVMRAALQADLLSLGATSRPLVQRPALGSTARAAATQSPGLVLLVRRGRRIEGPIVATLASEPAAQRTLQLAAHLANKSGGYLTILILAEQAEQAQQLRAQAGEWLRSRRLLVRYRRLTEKSSAVLAEAVDQERSGALVLGGAILPAQALEELLEGIECPVLLVRQSQ
jgi:nucleotide-binding universal stress UspA family protein